VGGVLKVGHITKEFQGKVAQLIQTETSQERASVVRETMGKL
jgi:hypothetical protein